MGTWLSKTVNVLMSCMHCEDAALRDVCPTGASYKAGRGRHRAGGPERCMGCNYCSWACPVRCPQAGSGPGVMKCTLCVDRIYDANCCRGRAASPRASPARPCAALRRLTIRRPRSRSPRGKRGGGHVARKAWPIVNQRQPICQGPERQGRRCEPVDGEPATLPLGSAERTARRW